MARKIILGLSVAILVLFLVLGYISMLGIAFLHGLSPTFHYFAVIYSSVYILTWLFILLASAKKKSKNFLCCFQVFWGLGVLVALLVLLLGISFVPIYLMFLLFAVPLTGIYYLFGVYADLSISGILPLLFVSCFMFILGFLVRWKVRK